ncbi:MAG: ribonuclease P protein component [Bacteroidales bacterium]|nr:ribonuclease P protein component [Bacteroidales bacterium]
MKPNSLPKAEIVSGRLAVSALLENGKGGTAGCLRYKWVAREEPSRIMVSVPKKLFRRAVKRNLLKRRIREAYRVQKSLIGPIGLDILFVYVSKAVLPFETIYADMTAALTAIASCHSEPVEESHE